MTATARPQGIRIIDGAPQLVDFAPSGHDDDVRVRVASTSICGSDLHLLDLGFAEGRILGHEFAGTTDDGTPVTVEPILSCGECLRCEDGERAHCDAGSDVIGIGRDGGLATEVMVPAQTIVPLPTGLDLSTACMVEPVAVGLHGANRAQIRSGDRVLIVGAGPIGLCTAAVLRDRGCTFDVAAKHDHQAAAASALGAREVVADARLADGGYDVVIDAVGNRETVETAVQQLVPQGRLVMLGVFWEPVPIGIELLNKEINLVPAMMYRGTQTPTGDSREFVEAARIVHDHPDIAQQVVTHRFPLTAAAEAFAAARNRSAGVIKVAFTPAID